MALAIFQGSTDPVFVRMQNQWATQINPVIANPMNQARIIQNIALADGVTVINHQLGRNQQGWLLIDIQGDATVYRSAPFNSQTLTLTSSAAVTVSIGVF